MCLPTSLPVRPPFNPPPMENPVLSIALTSLSSVPDGLQTMPFLAVAAGVVYLGFKFNQRTGPKKPERKS